MYAIDEARRKITAAGEELKRNVSGHEARIRLLRERETTLQGELEAAQALVAAAREGMMKRCGDSTTGSPPSLACPRSWPSAKANVAAATSRFPSTSKASRARWTRW